MFIIVRAGSSVWYECLTCKQGPRTQEDAGSNPARSTMFSASFQLDKFRREKARLKSDSLQKYVFTMVVKGQ